MVARQGPLDRDYVAVSLPWFAHHADRIPTLVQTLGAELVLVPRWGFVWVLVGLGLLLRPPVGSAGRGFLLVAVAAHLFSLTIIYTFSAWSPYLDHVHASLGRVAFEVVPIGLLLVATGVDRDWALSLGRSPSRAEAAEARVSP
jgi:hypothetical protein